MILPINRLFHSKNEFVIYVLDTLKFRFFPKYFGKLAPRFDLNSSENPLHIFQLF